MCEGGMYALIRTKANSKVGIRCNFNTVDPGRSPPQVFFSGVSEFGLSKLRVGEVVRFEVIGMPSKVIFQSKISGMGSGSICCDLPKSLVSIERRSAARSSTRRNLMAYMKLGIWNPAQNEAGAPPVFDHHHEIFNWIPVFDISIGGVCLRTHFPSVLSSLMAVDSDRNAQLILPMNEPLMIPSTFRWQRRIKNRFVEAGEERYQLDFRIGVEFNHLRDEQLMKIKQFIRQLSVADAI